MKPVRKTYIEFLHPSLNRSMRRVKKTRDTSKVKVPWDAYGFKFFDILSVVVKDAEGKKVRLTSVRFNVSPMHYYGGKIYTITELKRAFPNEYFRIVNFGIGQRPQAAILCRTGNWQPFKKTDIFIEERKS